MLQYVSAVFMRELHRMLARPIYLYGAVFVLAFSAIFLFTLMHEGQPRRVPVGMVDLDDSYISRTAYNQINALEGVEIVHKYSSYTEARSAMQKGDIYGFVVIPEGTYIKAVNGEQPTISCYYTEAFLVPGTFAYRNFMTITTVLNMGVKRSVLRGHGVSEATLQPQLQPIITEIHGIGNPWGSYAIYLISIIWPGILSLCIIVMTVFTIGFELKSNTALEWYNCAGKSLVNALIGKLLPYFIIYLITGVSFELLAYRIIGYPLMGPFWAMVLTISMLVLASFGAGIFFIGLFPVLRDALSGASLYSILGLSMSGMTYPVESMIGPMQGFAQIFPIRQYYIVAVKWGILGSGFGDCWTNLLGFSIFCIIPFMVLGRLKNAIVNQNYYPKE